MDREPHLIDAHKALTNGVETFFGEVPKRDCGGMELDVILSDEVPIVVKVYGLETTGGTKTLIDTINLPAGVTQVFRVLTSIACGAFPIYQIGATVTGTGVTGTLTAALKNCRNMDRSAKVEDGTITGESQVIADVACDASTRAAL